MHKQMLAILNALNDGRKRMNSRELMRKLHLQGIPMSDRTVRRYFKILDEQGYTVGDHGKGRTITRKGEEELSRMFAFHRAGSVERRINNLSFLTDLDPKTGKGGVILNVTFVPETKIREALDLLGRALNSACGMSNRIVIKHPGETIGSLTVPEHKAAIGTVCSITLNGILLKAGITVWPRFGGVVEITGNSPTRFLSVISYQGSSVAPLGIFMESRMTDVLGALRFGMGRVLGSFREIPDGGLEEAKRVVKEMEKIGFGGRILFGRPGQALLGIPVTPDKAGLVVPGGLNPAAALMEAGIAEETHAMAAVYDYSGMSPVRDPANRSSRFEELGLPESLHTLEQTVRPGYWSVFKGLKQSTF